MAIRVGGRGPGHLARSKGVGALVLGALVLRDRATNQPLTSRATGQYLTSRSA